MIIQDQTGTLSHAAISHLEATGYSFNPRVIILSKSPDNMSDYIHQLGTLDADQLIMVVDFPGHQVRTVGGPNLTDHGVDGSFLKRMQQECFVPQMRKHDLEGAIHKSMDFVQNQVKTAETIAAAPVTSQPLTVINQPQAPPVKIDFAPLWGGMFFTVAAVVISVVVIKKSVGTFKLRQVKTDLESELRFCGDLVNELSFFPEAGNWVVQFKTLEDDYSAFKVSKADDKLVTVTQLRDRATSLHAEGNKLVEKLTVRKPFAEIPLVPQQGGLIDRALTPKVTATEPYYAPPAKEPIKFTITAAPVIINNEPVFPASFYEPRSASYVTPVDEEPVKHHSSSYSSHSSSSSDSGSSSWSSGSSSDSGSSSCDSGSSSSSDSGSSGW